MNIGENKASLRIGFYLIWSQEARSTILQRSPIKDMFYCTKWLRIVSVDFYTEEIGHMTENLGDICHIVLFIILMYTIGS